VIKEKENMCEQGQRKAPLSSGLKGGKFLILIQGKKKNFTEERGGERIGEKKRKGGNFVDKLFNLKGENI